LATSLHSPDIIKYFGGNNIVIGRTALENGLKNWFKNSTIKFTENSVESTIFTDTTAIQTKQSFFQLKLRQKTEASM